MSWTPTIVVDWDGTAVPHDWPNQPQEFLPGFVDAMRRFHAAGYRLTIFSARLNPEVVDFVPVRTQAEELAYVRGMLDKHDLHFVDIYTGLGKPAGVLYIDDRAERYHGCSGCWNRLADKVLRRLGAKENT